MAAGALSKLAVKIAQELIKSKNIKLRPDHPLTKSGGSKPKSASTKSPSKDKKTIERKVGGALKPIDPETQPGLAALKKESPETVNKMGYAKKCGRIVSAMTGGQIVSMMYDD